MKPTPKPTAATVDTLEFNKIVAAWPVHSAYAVLYAGRVIGYVWSEEGFSYRGMNGWNSGIRIRDFHPTVWGYCIKLEDVGRGKCFHSRRSHAASNLPITRAAALAEVKRRNGGKR